MLPVGQLQGLDVLQRDAVLQQEAAQVRCWELWEDVGDIWGGETQSSADLQEAHMQKPGCEAHVLGTLSGHAGDCLTTLGSVLTPWAVTQLLKASVYQVQNGDSVLTSQAHGICPHGQALSQGPGHSEYSLYPGMGPARAVHLGTRLAPW